MATKVHHKYRVGQVLHCGSNFMAWDIHGDKWDVGPLTGTIRKQIRRNNRSAYTVEMVKGSNPIWPKTIIVTQQMITAGDIEIQEPWIPGVPDSSSKEDSSPVVDRSSKIRESLEDLCTAATTSPIRDKIVELLAVELDTLHTDIAILTEKEAKLLDLMAKVKNL